MKGVGPVFRSCESTIRAHATHRATRGRATQQLHSRQSPVHTRPPRRPVCTDSPALSLCASRNVQARLAHERFTHASRHRAANANTSDESAAPHTLACPAGQTRRASAAPSPPGRPDPAEKPARAKTHTQNFRVPKKKKKGCASHCLRSVQKKSK